MTTNAQMPLCSAFAREVREAFGDGRTTCFGAVVRYAQENGRTYGKKGDEGVAVVVPDDVKA